MTGCRIGAARALALASGLVAALVAPGGPAFAAGSVPPPPEQTPVLTVNRLCWSAKGVVADVTVERTGATFQLDDSGAIVAYVPVDYLLGDADRNEFSQTDVRAASLGATLTATSTVPGSYAVGQVVHLYVVADDSNSGVYDPNSAPVAATVSSCGAPAPSATFTTARTSKPHTVKLTAAVSKGAGPLRYAWRAVVAKRSVAIGAGRVVTRRFTKAGSYAVTLTVTAKDGRTASTTRTVRVG